MPFGEEIIIGILGNLATDAIKKGFTASFGEKNHPLLQKAYDAADRAIKTFFNEYPHQFGKPKDSFLARQENWDSFFNCLRFGSPAIDELTINPQGFNGELPVTSEALQFFLASLENEMRNYPEIDDLLAHKTHFAEGRETLAAVNSLGKKLDALNHASIPQRLTNRIPETSRVNIVGRSSDLDKLHRSLFDNKKVVLMNGMGGIGKTTLAQVYIATYKEEYKHIAWVSQLTGDILGSFINSEGLPGNLSISKDGKKPEELFQEIISSMNRITDAPNLLVIDNAEISLSEYFDYLPKQPNWHILVTSRNKIERFDLQEVGFLSVEEAIELFLSHYTLGKISRDKIESLVELVELHTLTIEILAKSAQLQRFDIEKLEQAIEIDLKANVHIAHSGKKIERITSYLCSIFKMDGLSENEIWLLKQFACLPSEFIEYEFLNSLVCPEGSDKREALPETIELLSSKGWLLKNSDNDSFKMHRIIADVVIKQNSIEVEDVAALIGSICYLLRIDQTKDNPVDKFPFIPYGKSVLSVFPDNDNEKISRLQNNLATVLQDLGDYTGALSLSEKSVEIFKKTLPEGHPNIKTVIEIRDSIKECYR